MANRRNNRRNTRRDNHRADYRDQLNRMEEEVTLLAFLDAERRQHEYLQDLHEEALYSGLLAGERLAEVLPPEQGNQPFASARNSAIRHVHRQPTATHNASAWEDRITTSHPVPNQPNTPRHAAGRDRTRPLTSGPGIHHIEGFTRHLNAAHHPPRHENLGFGIELEAPFAAPRQRVIPHFVTPMPPPLATRIERAAAHPASTPTHVPRQRSGAVHVRRDGPAHQATNTSARVPEPDNSTAVRRTDPIGMVLRQHFPEMDHEAEPRVRSARRTEDGGFCLIFTVNKGAPRVREEVKNEGRKATVEDADDE
ncbi:hypothetical protein MMC30_003630 [Trapelia coarctata]|nr:hypothetical protein [Trapelia coarctata]